MKFEVLHDIVGPFKKGDIISKEQLGDTDIDRLLNIHIGGNHRPALKVLDDNDKRGLTGEPQPGPHYGPNAPKSPVNPRGFTNQLQEVQQTRPVEFQPTPIHKQTAKEGSTDAEAKAEAEVQADPQRPFVSTVKETRRPAGK